MSTHSLTYRDEAGESWASAEDSPDAGVDLLVWADEWSDHPKGTEIIVKRFGEWAAANGIRYKIAAGNH